MSTKNFDQQVQRLSISTPPTKSNVIGSILKTLNVIQDASRSASFLLNMISKKEAKKGKVQVKMQNFISEWKDYMSQIAVVLEYLLILVQKTDFKNDQLQSLLNITKNIRFSLKTGDNSLAFVILGNVVFRQLFKNTMILPFSNVIWIALVSFLQSQFETLFPQLSQSSKSLTGIVRGGASIIKESLMSQVNTKLEELKETNPELHEKIQTQLNKLEMATYLPGILAATAKKYTKKQSKKYMPIISLIIENAINSSFETFQTSKVIIREVIAGNIPISVIFNQLWAIGFAKKIRKLFNLNEKSQNRSKL